VDSVIFNKLFVKENKFMMRIKAFAKRSKTPQFVYCVSNIRHFHGDNLLLRRRYFTRRMSSDENIDFTQVDVTHTCETVHNTYVCSYIIQCVLDTVYCSLLRCILYKSSTKPLTYYTRCFLYRLRLRERSFIL